MKIDNIRIYTEILPLKKPFAHGSKVRTKNETIFLELRSGNFSGWGEALPREYVSGENPKRVIKNLQKYAHELSALELKSVKDISYFLDYLESPESRDMASLCAVDMALLDLYGKEQGVSVSTLLYKNKRQEVRVHSSPIGLGCSVWKKRAYILAGLPDIKLKVNKKTTPEMINRIGTGILTPRTLRLDGNESLTPQSLDKLLRKVSVPIQYVEEPFRGYKHFPWTRLMSDESLVSYQDSLEHKFEAGNVRIGKNGGLLRSLKIINSLLTQNIGFMVGSLVGETSLLSSALLHLASGVEPIVVEGCYTQAVLTTDPTDTHIRIGYKGKVNFNYNKPGLGVNIDTQKMLRIS